MRDIASLRRNALELAWGAFVLASLAAMLRWPPWSPAPFHFVWVSLALVYGFRVWRPWPTAAVLAAVAALTGAIIARHALDGEPWIELVEVPLMSAMFLAMVWHARRRQQAIDEVQRIAEERARLLERRQRFLEDVSHELRTPVTIARGHLEELRRVGGASSESEVALDELQRIDRIVERLLLLARTDQPTLLAPERFDVETFLEDVFMRWAETTPRQWRVGRLPAGTLAADVDALRAALDALLENAVKHTGPGDRIELDARTSDGELVIEVADEGGGISPAALDLIFDRFARADVARNRADGGVGLGLAIVDSVAKAHGGECTVRSSPRGSTFSLRLPQFEADAEDGARVGAALR